MTANSQRTRYILSLAGGGVLATGIFIAGCGSSGGTTATSGGNAANGKTLFTAKCGVCHTISGVSTGTTGPNLSHIGSLLTQAQIEQQIQQPYRTVQGYQPGLMPPGLVSGSDTTDIAAYLESLK